MELISLYLHGYGKSYMILLFTYSSPSGDFIFPIRASPWTIEVPIYNPFLSLL